MPQWDTLDVVERARYPQWGMGVSQHPCSRRCAVCQPSHEATIEDFLEWFPGLTRAQVEAVLDYEAQALHTPRSARISFPDEA